MEYGTSTDDMDTKLHDLAGVTIGEFPCTDVSTNANLDELLRMAQGRADAAKPANKTLLEERIENAELHAKVVSAVVAVSVSVAVSTAVGGAVASAVATTVATTTSTTVAATVSSSVASTAGSTAAASASGSVAGSSAGGVGGGAGSAGSSGPQGGNVMGMISQVQFMNLCAAGNMGAPPETEAMADGFDWANLQFEAPWTHSQDGGGNASYANSSNRSAVQRRQSARERRARRYISRKKRYDQRAMLRREFVQNKEYSGDAPETAGDTEEKASEGKTDARDTFEGFLFYTLGLLFAEGGFHYVLLLAIEFGTGVARTLLPHSVRFPAFEIGSFLGIWNPICLTSTMALAEYSADFDADAEAYGGGHIGP